MNIYYKIFETKLKSYTHIIFSLSYINPIDQKEAIEEDLKKKRVKGEILFDLLLSHGNNPDRFYEAYFDGEKINKNGLRTVKSIPKTIKKISLEFYHKQGQILECSVLSKAQKFLIKRKQLI